MAEDEVMRILLLVRNFLPAHEEIARGEVRCISCRAFEASSRAAEQRFPPIGELASGCAPTHRDLKLRPKSPIASLLDTRKLDSHRQHLLLTGLVND